MTQPVRSSAISPPVVIATVTGGWPRIEYVTSLLDARPLFSGVIFKDGQHYLDDARNICVDRFLDMDLPHDSFLLFVDDDQTFTPDDVHNLFAKATADHLVIGGLYLTTSAPIGPVVYRFSSIPGEFNDAEHFNQVTMDEIREVPRDDHGFIQVDAIGTGFLAIRRSLLVEMCDTWHAPKSPFSEQVINGISNGEDFTFCARVRQMGHAIHLQPDVRVGHVKPMLLIEKD